MKPIKAHHLYYQKPPNPPDMRKVKVVAKTPDPIPVIKDQIYYLAEIRRKLAELENHPKP
jgi:hypothetical protein